MRNMNKVGVTAAVCLLLLTGCARSGPTATSAPPATEAVAPGDIPDTQAFITAAAPSGRWQVQVPEGWAKRGTASGFVFTDKYNAVDAAEAAAPAAPTVATARTTEVPVLRKTVGGFTLTAVRTVIRSHASGVQVVYTFDSAKDPVTGRVHRDQGETYLFWRSGREVRLTLSGAVGADNVDPWRTITDSFRWLP